MDNELISVIVPVYNTEKYLKKCIESIVSQSYRKLEIILVDDGSSDSSSDICDYYAERDSRIKVFHNKNAGASLSRRFGLENSHGAYVAFADSDDFMAADMLLKLFNRLEKDGSDLCVCQYEIFSESGGLSPAQPNPLKDTVISGTELIEFLGRAEGEQLVPLWNKLYRREVFSGIQFPGPMFCEDELLIHRILYKCRKVSIIPENLYFYLRRDGSRSSCIDDRYILDGAYAFIDRCLFLKQKGFYKSAVLALTGAVNLIYAADTKKENKARERLLSESLKDLYSELKAFKPGLRTKLKLFLLPNWKFIYKAMRKFKAFFSKAV